MPPTGGALAPMEDEPFNAEGRIPLYPNGRKKPSAPKPKSIMEVLQLALGAGMAVEGIKGLLTPAIDMEKTADVLGADLRLTPDQLRSATERARDATNLAPGSTTGENMASLLDLKTVFGSFDEAKEFLPQFAQMQALFKVLDHQHGGKGDQAFAAAKAMEILGEMTVESKGPNGETVRTLDPKKGMEHFALMQRVAGATNMRVMPSDYLGLARSARVAGMTLDDEFVFEKLPAIMATEGASRTGTALMSAAMVFRGGKLTNKSMDALIGIGLASPDGDELVGAHRTKEGRLVGGHHVVHPDAIYDIDMLMHDPLSYVTAAVKRMDVAGIHGGEAQINALMSASQRSPIAGLLGVLLKDQPAILKEQENIRNTDPNLATKIGTESTAAKVQQLQAAFHNMLTDIGAAALGDAGKALESLTVALKGVGHWAHDNPEGTKAALEGLAFGITALGAKSVLAALDGLGGGGKGKLFVVAGGLLAMSGALDKFPAWLVDMIKGATAGGAVLGVPGAIAGGLAAPLWNLIPAARFDDSRGIPSTTGHVIRFFR